MPLAPRVARAVDLAIGERLDGPIFIEPNGRRLDRHAAGRIVRRVARRAEITKRVGPHTLRHAFITAALDAGVPLRDVHGMGQLSVPAWVQPVSLDRSRRRARTSSSSWPAVAIRSVVIGPSTCTLARSFSARATLSERPVPPSMSRHSNACSRQIERVRWAVIWWSRSAQQPQHDPMLVVARDDVQRRCAPRHDRHRAGVVGIGLVDPARSRSRTRDDNLGGTSTTCSPAPTSCWASIALIPVAPSTAHVRGSGPDATEHPPRRYLHPP